MADSESKAEARRPVKRYEDADFTVIVAIDFGTHGTGLGWTRIPDQKDNKEPELHQFTGWCRSTDKKTKTDILLTKDGEFLAFGDTALEQYLRITDDDVHSDDDDDDDDDNNDKKLSEEEIQKRRLERLQQKRMLFESFKMALYVKVGSEHDGDIRAQLMTQDTKRLYSTEQVFVEALKHIKEQILKEFQEKKVVLEKGIKNIQWILTVPAIWSDRAKNKMERWAEKAGLISKKIFSHLRIVYEPDCASISCQYEAANEDEKSFQPGERYILIDAGGGTVDIAWHEVVEEYKMDEIHCPTGGPWGSVGIDEEFESLLMDIFGDAAIMRFKEYRNSAYLFIKNNFRTAKMSFYSKPKADSHRVELTTEFMEAMVTYCADSLTNLDESDVDYVQKGFAQLLKQYKDYVIECRDSDLYLPAKLWREYLFDKVIDPIIEHVNSKIEEIQRTSQHKKKFTYLCLAGGLAASPYFKIRMGEAFGSDSRHKLSIRIPRAPILSVVDGALRLGLRPDYIKTRCVKVTYGIAVDRGIKYIEKEKLPPGWMDKNSYTQRNTKKLIVRNLFSPFIKINEAIGVDESIHKQYRRFHKKDKAVNLAIYQSNDKEVPYVVQPTQKKLAGVQVTFPADYTDLPFVVLYYFGSTKLIAKVIYTTEAEYLKWKHEQEKKKKNERQDVFEKFETGEYLELKYEYYTV